MGLKMKNSRDRLEDKATKMRKYPRNLDKKTKAKNSRDKKFRGPAQE